MSIATLIRRMTDAGAPPEAIAIAVEEIEALQMDLGARRSADRDRKRAQRERQKSANVTGQSVDSHGTVTDNSLSPLDPPLKVSPDPFKITPPISPLSQRAEVQGAVQEWNRLAERIGLSKVRGALTGKRLSSLKARLAEHGMDGFREALTAIERSPFCRGEKTDWKADFEFLVTASKFQKLIEGGFDPAGSTPRPASFLDSYKARAA